MKTYVIKYKAPNPGRKVCFREMEAATAEEAVAELQRQEGKWAEVILGVYIKVQYYEVLK